MRRLLLLCLALGCSTETPPIPDAGPDAGALTDTGTATVDAGFVADAGERVDIGPGMGVPFRVRIENISGGSAFPTAFAPGAFATHAVGTPLFAESEPDRGDGLERLAEDGDPAPIAARLAASTEVLSSGTFTQPAGAMSSGPIQPGEAFEFIAVGRADRPRLSFATMLVDSNDLFVGGPSTGIDLLDASGMPLPAREVPVTLWDLGTESDEPPGAGASQARNQAAAGTGSPEGVVALHTGSTRALPLASALVELEARKLGDDRVRITVRNLSGAKGACATSISGAFWAVHAASWKLFEDGRAASTGLERLAEQGLTSPLGDEHRMAAGVASSNAELAKAGPGESYSFDLTVRASEPLLSIAIGISESNDAFLAFPPGGVSLLDEMGRLIEDAALSALLNRRLALWDAGTERNEVPGAGPNQAARQLGNTGEPDPMAVIRRHRDPTNDLAGPRVGGLVRLSILGRVNGSFDVSLENTSGNTAFPTLLSPLVWMLHDGSVKLFTPGSVASRELEALAEDGDPNPLKGTLNAVSTAEVVRTPEGSPTVGPILAGERYTFSVRPTAARPVLNLAAMMLDTNDSFIALGVDGVRLVDAGGNPRGDTEIANEIASKLAAYDAGTEGNQAGACGADQGTRQLAAGRGPADGTGKTRRAEARVFEYPSIGELIRVRVSPE